MRPLAGPSELARHGLLSEVPAGYFERYRAQAAARIRRETERAPCTCARPYENGGPAGRCGRCFGGTS